jgi:hypothetical protein
MLPMDAGYSGTPLVKKLGIAPDSRVLVVRPVDGFLEAVSPFDEAEDDLDVAVAFCTTREELQDAIDLRDKIKKNGAIWISWPKKSSKLPTELTEDTLREIGLPTGLVDNKVCAINEQWSGLRFVWRKELR